MSLDLPITKTFQTGYQILAYLVEHPKAQDTVEGIVEWWLLERAIKYQKTQIVKAIAERHAGQVHAESQTVGARFSVLLPTLCDNEH